MEKYYTLDLIERDVTGMKWATFFTEDDEITIVFDKNGVFVGFEDYNNAVTYDPNFEVGEWEDYTIRGEYKKNA